MSTPQITTFPPQTQLPTLAPAATAFTVGTVVEPFSYRVFGGATGVGTRTTVTAADGSRAVAVVDSGGAVLLPGSYTVIDSAAPATASAGATTATFDREVTTWCDPTTGAGVAVVTLWNQTAAVGSGPLVEAYTLNGAPYAGTISALVKCAVTDVEVVSQEMCSGTASYTRTSFFEAGTRVVQGTLWQDATGAVVATPAGPFTVGGCPDVTPRSIGVSFRDLAIGTVLTGAALQTSLGATARLLSVMVRQSTGVGSITGTDGGTVALATGESLSWTADSAKPEDVMNTGFSVDSGTGVQRVIATYR